MKNTQNKTVELYNRNSDYYWNVEKFVTEQGYQNVCAYCADVLTKVTIKDKALIIDVAHHDGKNQYILYFNDLWYKGDI